MNKENSIHETTWDYSGYDPHPAFNYQKDWNQTLVTKINFISAKILQSSKFKGADTLEINPKLLSLFETLYYYDTANKILSERYNVIVNPDVEGDTIYVYNKTYLDNLIFIPLVTKEGSSSMYGELTMFKLPEALNEGVITQEQISEYKKGLSGYIIIENLMQPLVNPKTRIDLYNDFTKFITEINKDEYNDIITSGYINFIDKEVGATMFITDKFLEFCEGHGYVEINKDLLCVYGLWYNNIVNVLTRYEND